jgi:flagellar motor switch protein FliN/FliY
MGDENLINQDEIEKLLQQHASKPEPTTPADELAETPSPAKAEASAPLDQSEIEALLAGGGEETPSPPKAPSQAPVATRPRDDALARESIEKLPENAASTSAPQPQASHDDRLADSPIVAEGSVSPGDVEYLLNQAERAIRSIDEADASGTPPGARLFDLEEFSGATPSTENATLDLISDVELDLRIELGRTNMYLEDVLKLRKGAVVTLDKLAGDPVDIYVNERLIARGEVLVLNDNFCVRVGELIAGSNPAA